MDEMTNFPEAHPGRRPWSLVWPALSCAVVVLAAVWLGLLWWRPATTWQELSVAAVLLLAALLGSVWQFRARARRRLRAAVDAYAEREIARSRRDREPRRLRPSAPGRRAWPTPADL
jgi:Flp pilus assembly protein TadB